MLGKMELWLQLPRLGDIRGKLLGQEERGWKRNNV
jgi:hypothetical protein